MPRAGSPGVNCYRDSAGQTTWVVLGPLMFRAHPRLANLELAVEAEDWTGTLVPRSRLDSQVRISTTSSGDDRKVVHLGAIGAAVDLVLQGYAGIGTRDDTLRLHPLAPPELRKVTVNVVYRGQPSPSSSHPHGHS